MTSQDAELWDTLLSSVLRSAETKGIMRLEILKRVVAEMTDELYVLGATAELCRD